MTTKPNAVVFIHGRWIHAGAWQPWMDLFAERGYAVSAPGWPGDPKPVVVGHSFGGLIAQELLAGGHVAAAVAIDPAPIEGVTALPLAQLRSASPDRDGRCSKMPLRTSSRTRRPRSTPRPSANRHICAQNPACRDTYASARAVISRGR
ncbi:pimeloyl-ACP methyl ester carboxylesterase [Mycobacterium sp. MAA66]|uniref:alpha/beta hydrolase n=1 Tax=Mycobacterium sp. MAA66 TaxID=3156297 RepID=UPI0035181B2A